MVVPEDDSKNGYYTMLDSEPLLNMKIVEGSTFRISEKR